MKSTEISSDYRAKFLKNQIVFDKKFRPVFAKVAKDISRLVNDPSAKYVKGFDFSRSKGLTKRIGDIMIQFHNNTLRLTQGEIKFAWDLSNAKTSLQIQDYLAAFKGLKVEEKYIIPNLPEFQRYMSRIKASKLSDNIWQVSKQFRWELQTHLALGIMNGDSAHNIALRIQKYLNNPDDLFRRVRDKNGRLQVTGRMKAYHPGRGKYRSAYKNALRIARTETNRAYLKADAQRWRNNSLVIGVKVSLSEQHPEYNYPEICEVLAGDYPKNFEFTGWHPQCLCHATPILVNKTDFRAWLRGDQPKPTGSIALSDNFKNYIRQNASHLKGLKSPPYWLEDNKEIIDGLLKGVKEQSIISKIRGAKTIDQLTDIGKEMGLKMTHNITSVNSMKEMLEEINFAQDNFKLRLKAIGELGKKDNIDGAALVVNPELMKVNSKIFNSKDYASAVVGDMGEMQFAALTPKATIDHELGHLLTIEDMDKGGPFMKELMPIWEKYSKETEGYHKTKGMAWLLKTQRNKAEFTKYYISETAGFAETEFAAECFSAFLNLDNPNKYVVDVFNLIVKHFGRK